MPPEASVVDISHDVAWYDLRQASYLLLSSYKNFPAGAIHIVAVDVLAGSPPRMLLAEKDGYWFLAPDNGLLPLAFDGEISNTRLCAGFAPPVVFRQWYEKLGEVAGAILAGDVARFGAYVVKNAPRIVQPKLIGTGIECNILYVDHYENVVLDITKTQFEDFVQRRPFKIRLLRARDITVVSNNYNDVPPGEPLCRFNGAGFLEIAVNRSSAAASLGLDREMPGDTRYRTIKIAVMQS